MADVGDTMAMSHIEKDHHLGDWGHLRRSQIVWPYI